MAFQMMFAVITPALISGAIAGRMKLSAWMIFIAVWSVVVYAPMAHWVWGGGIIGGDLGAIDFAGGLVVHINAGAAALAAALVLGPRIGFPRDLMRPHALPLTLLGAGILWFGWFGFNAGSALAADGAAANAFVTTQVAAAVAATTWIIVGVADLREADHARRRLGRGRRPRRDHPGRRLRRPAGGDPDRDRGWRGLLLGAADQVPLRLRRTRSTSWLCTSWEASSARSSWACSPTPTSAASRAASTSCCRQAASVVIAVVYSFVVSYVLLRIIKATIGLRVTEEEERRGLDLSLHDEQAYVLSD